MKSGWVRFLIVAVLGFVLGGGFALTQKYIQLTRAPATVIKQKSPVPAPVATPATPAAEPVAGVPVGGAFSLTDHKGAAVTEKSWPGKYKLVFFGFTHCPDICPAGMQKLSAVMENYDAKGEKLVPLLVTVDPERDTKEVMAAYVGNYNTHIIGLTGSKEQIAQAVDAYKVFSSKIMPEATHDADHAGDHSANYMVDHSGYVYLMSPDDKLLETFSSGDTAEAMIAKIKAHTEQH